MWIWMREIGVKIKKLKIAKESAIIFNKCYFIFNSSVTHTPADIIV